MKKMMGIDYKIRVIEKQEAARINFINQKLIGIMIDLEAYQIKGEIHQKELWLLTSGSCIETIAIIKIKNIIGITIHQVISRTIIRKAPNGEIIRSWNLSDIQKARLKAFKKVFKTCEEFSKVEQMIIPKDDQINSLINHKRAVQVLAFVIAGIINEEGAKQYFGTTNKLEIILQISAELSVQRYLIKSSAVEIRLMEMEKIIGKKSLEHIFHNPELYDECKELNIYKIQNKMDLETFYSKERILIFSQKYAELNKKYTS